MCESDAGTFILMEGDSTNVDATGFSLRRRGVEMRDCIAVQSPEGPSFILVGQFPSDQTFVEQVVRGQGSVLNIDGARVTSTGDHKRPFQPTRNERNVYGEQTGFMPTNAEGRFPANVILRHGRGCECVGTKKVKNNNNRNVEDGSIQDTKARSWKNSSIAGIARIGYGSEDGTEEVANWICQPGCPVATLDAQSGNRPGCKSPSDATQTSIYRPGQGSYQKQGPIYGDDGGASRFFKQVQSDEELNAYLDLLVRGNS